MKRLRTIPVLVACVIVLAGPETKAQQARTTGAATVLFDEAAALIEKGKYAEACPKLARSHELSPNGGTLLALADCYERNGQTASAWVSYREATIRARAAGRADAEKKATDAAERLAPNVSQLFLHVRPESIDGLTITLDGRPLARSEWEIALPVDPGPHAVVATAPGRIPATREIVFDDGAKQKSIAVPVLERDPKAVQRAPTRGGTQRVLGLLVSGVGLGGLAVGAIFGLTASSKNNDAASHCGDRNLCDPEGLRLDREAHDAATVSTFAFIAGGTLAVGGLVLLLTAPRGAEKTASPVGMVRIRGTGGGAGITFGSAF